MATVGDRIAPKESKEDMPFIIDGHNLIPHIHGLSLTQIDDEFALINILDSYFKTERKKAVVYFDKAAPLGEQNLHRGFLSVHFTRPPMDADNAILNAVRTLGRSASNYTIVSSDQKVKDNARKMGAQVLSSAEFAKKLKNNAKSKINVLSEPADDVEYWLKIFGKNS
jgi:predicted RNA-binding protein with PIN domain